MSETKTELMEGGDPHLPSLPSNLGRYRVSSEIGCGGFGRVYLAFDELLKRQVAVKLLHLDSAATAIVPSLLAEARAIAQMNHVGILPIFDAMETDDGEFCIVSPFVEGKTLRQLLAEKPFSHEDAARLIARICDALHHAHQRGVVHRDVKPANIMITPDGSPVLLDFGLAKSLQDVGKDFMVAGTPGYISPEQARGEDHLVNGRSDIFSLGTVFYEMLTSRRAFRVSSFAEQLERVATGEPVPPRDAVPTIPKELSRICMKALNPQMRWRYPVALDMAEDLHAWIATLEHTVIDEGVIDVAKVAREVPPRTEAVRVVPRGLRAFDEGDSDFFLQLIPGPRDQYGLPESLRFWKQRIESHDPHLAFRVGVIYGPSGCGKSSLLSAGLLPRCADHVQVVFHEARHAGNAARLARSLQAAFPALDQTESRPANLIHQIRSGGMLKAPAKLLVVIDQTEQWLRACETNDSEDADAILNTLRQCDGIHVQALLLVRDDFWRGVSRLLTAADVELRSDNSALVDLFEPRHARMILESFGRAYQCLPNDPTIPLTAEAQAFIGRSVENLAEDGKISPVRLALFTEIFRTRQWTVASLRDVGGPSGVAVAFLEDVFRGASAVGPRRVHVRAARGVFERLVPPTGDVRGPSCRQSALLEASGYADKPEAFHELINVLDADLRLLTPVDAEEGSEPAWQLTHDYMVPAIRHWMLAQKATTRGGRAEIALTERAREWSQRPDRTRLPGFWEWVRLRVLTKKARWSSAESSWMHAGMRSVRQVALAALVVAGAALLALGQWRSSVRGRALAERILGAAPEEVAALAAQGAEWERWTKPLLEQRLADPVSSPAGRNARLALAEGNRNHVETLAAAMIDADAHTFGAIRQVLSRTPSAVPLAVFRQTLEAPETPNGRKLRALAALAAFAGNDAQLSQFAPEAGRWLVTSTDDIAGWAGNLQPIASEVSPALEEMLASPEADTHSAAASLASLHANNQGELIRLIHPFPPTEVSLLVTQLKNHRGAGELISEALVKARDSRNSGAADESDGRFTGECNLVLAGLSLGMGEQCWPYFSRQTHRPLRSEILWYAASAGVPAEVLVTRLKRCNDAGERQGLLMALRGYSFATQRALIQQELTQWLPRALETDPDGGVHSAIIGLMNHWSLARQAAAMPSSSAAEPHADRNWWITPSGVDMRIIAMPDRRRVALAARELTVEEFQKLRKAPNFRGTLNTDLTAPVTGLSWANAAQYCNALSASEGMGPDDFCYVEENGEWEVVPDAVLRKGYRLPTKEEWLEGAKHEFESRGTALQAPRYGWIAVNAGDRPRPVARLLPNEYGLWDTVGNASEWVHNRSTQLGKPYAQSLGFDYTTVASALSRTEVMIAAPKLEKLRCGMRLARSLIPAPRPM